MNKTKFLQGDSRWGGLVYPKKPCYIRNVGCGEVSIANILIEMEQYKQYTPATIQPYCKQYGAPNCDGTYLSGICKMMKHYGLTNVKECDTMPELWKELEKGDRVAIYLMGARKAGSKGIKWTNGGHFIASTGYEYKNGKHYVYIKDPWTSASNRNGWLTYEEHLKGDVLGVYVGKLTGTKADTPATTKSGELTVDGIGGAATIRASQKFFGTVEDGVISDQLEKLKGYYPSITSVEFGKGKSGSSFVKALQKWLGITADGLIGKGTTAAWQYRLRELGYLAKNETIDGIFGAKSMKAWQRFLNDQLFKKEETPKDPTPTDSGDTKPTVTPTVTVTTPTTEAKKSVYTVIDVSDWQRKIDWKQVKGDGIDGAIIRYADGTTLDARFTENMKGAIEAGLHVGAYIFSRAKTKAQAEAEADRLFNACKPYTLDMPMYIDLEVKGYGKYADTVARAFISRIKALGGKPGVYASLSWWNSYLKDVAKLSFAMWVAQYNNTMDYKPKSYVGMWQYTSSGRVNGINGNVDMDKCYVQYWEDKKEEPPKPSKSIDELAQEVLDGKWGSGDARKKNLTEAGYDYDAVQNRVNEILNPQQKTYQGEYPSLTLKKTNAEVIADAVRWAVWIAGDNAFHYGYTNKHGSKDSKDWNPNAHHNGCYFCGTNTDKGGRSKKGILDYEKTYCCNPFVGAAWAHGGCIPKALELCQDGSSWNFEKGTGYDKSKLFDNLGKPKKSALKKGDVLCSDSHVALYIGDGKIAEAAGGDDNKRNSTKWNNSIHVTTLTDKRYSGFKRVHRYNGSVNTTCNIYFGEISKRVENLQHYLIWYGYAITADGIFGEQTHACVKDLQTKLGLTADGIVGAQTLEAMAKVVK